MQRVILLVISAFVFISCNKEDMSRTQSLPDISTIAVSNITAASSAGGGNITGDGGSAVTSRGVCWSTAPQPTIADAHTSDGSGIGSYVSIMDGLQSGITYYVRAYATNSFGTAYGNEISFSTAQRKVYVGGAQQVNNLSPFEPAVWIDGAVVSLQASPVNSSGGSVRSLYLEGNNWYASGSYMASGYFPRAILWENGIPGFLTDGAYEATANSIAVTGGVKHIVGSDGGPTYSTITSWLNDVPSTLQTNTDGYGVAEGVALSGSDVYVVTRESDLSSNLKTVIWKNSTVANEIQSFAGFSIAVAGSDVLVGGISLGKAATWKNGTILPLPVPVTSSTSAVLSVFLAPNGDEYACGYIVDNGASIPAAWKNGLSIPIAITASGGSANGICVAGNDVYIAGRETIAGESHAVLWKNGASTDLGAGQALCVAVQ